MSGVEGREEMERTSRSIFDSFVWAFPLDLVWVGSSFPIELCTCTFSDPDGPNGNLVDMTMVRYDVLFTVVYNHQHSRNHSRPIDWNDRGKLLIN